jgi:hypothetical protein
MKELTCSQKIKNVYNDTMEDLRNIIDGSKEWADSTDYFDDLNQYGLSYDYVSPDNGENGYKRWQLSWGGPSDEFRIYLDYERRPYKIEYWYMDWFDGAKKELRGEDLQWFIDNIYYGFLSPE